MFESPENDTIKLIDLGLALVNEKKEISLSRRGSLFYMAPEMIKGNFNHKIDIWSAGVLFYLLVTGMPPYCGEKFDPQKGYFIHHKTLTEMILEGKVNYDLPIFDHLSSEVKNIIRAMLTVDYSNRPEARDILRSPWFKSQSLKNVDLNSSREVCLIGSYGRSLQQLASV